MMIEVSVGLIGLIAAVSTTIVGSAITVAIAARDTRRLVDDVRALLDRLARAEVRIDGHSHEIGRLRDDHGEALDRLAHVEGRCRSEHGSAE